MRLPPDLLDEIVEHARLEAPNECCGLIGTKEGTAVSVHRMRNLKASPLAFEMHGPDVVRVIDEIEEAGGELGGMYHSHTRTEPYPSQTDRNFAKLWPGLEWVIVGLDGDDAEVRSYLLDDGDVKRVDIE